MQNSDLKLDTMVRQCQWTLGENSAMCPARRSLGKFLLVVAFPLVKRHFVVHYMCCTRMAFRLGVGDSSSTAMAGGVEFSVFGR